MLPFRNGRVRRFPDGRWRKSWRYSLLRADGRSLERGGVFQDIEGLVLEVVNVRRRASSRYRQSLEDETASVRICARGEKAYPIAGPLIHRSCFCWDILRLILICHGC